jgi:DNA-binding NtrC family response regulator
MDASERRHVLIVDDDVGIIKIIAYALESVGFEVSACEGGNAALAFLDTVHPDVILTDIHMATGDGFELINAMRERGLAIPVVAMSGGSEMFGGDNLELARKLGAASIVDKPFRQSHLVEAIDRAIGGRSAPPRKS